MTGSTGFEPPDVDDIAHSKTFYMSPHALTRDQHDRGWLWVDRRTLFEASGDLTLAVRAASDITICWFTARSYFINGWLRQSLEPLIEVGMLAPAILLDRPWDDYEPAALSARIHELRNQRNVYWPQAESDDIPDAPPICGSCGATEDLILCQVCEGVGEISAECESEGDPDEFYECGTCDGTGLNWKCPNYSWRIGHLSTNANKSVE